MRPSEIPHELADVSRETLEKLEIYVGLLRKWNPKINLVAKSTLEDVWIRHILDSRQVFDHCPADATRWIDVGSGGGFPGLVVAILAHQTRPKLQVTLIESDLRKATFLRTVLRETRVAAEVVPERIENIPRLNADVMSARAVTDLESLLEMAARHLKPNGIALLPKGASWKTEMTKAQSRWAFSLAVHTSKTDRNAVVLQIGELAHV